MIPRLSADDVFTHEAHRWQKDSDSKWRGGCPWHSSKSGTSFYIDPGTKRWRCPACQIGGGPVQYLHRLAGGKTASPRGKEFEDIVRRLCELARVDFPERDLTPEQQEQARRREARRAVLDSVNAGVPAAALVRGRLVRAEYLLARGFTDDDAQALGLGLYPPCPS